MSEPTNNVESLLTAILKNDSSYLVVPQSRVEELLLAIYKNGGGGGGGSDITRYEVEQMLLGKVDTKPNYSLISDSEIERLAGVDNYDDKSIRDELGKKVQKENGYSLILNTDYDNFKKLENYDDSELRTLINDIAKDLESLVPNDRTIAGKKLDKDISVDDLLKALNLDKVNNTSDLDKPISNATQAALDTKSNKTFIDAIDNTTSVVTVPNDVAGFAAISNIKGVTKRFIQKAYNGDFAKTDGWGIYDPSRGTLAISDGVATITYTAAGSSGYIYGLAPKPGISVVRGHKYILSAEINPSKNLTISFDAVSGVQVECAPNKYTKVQAIFNCTADSTINCLLKPVIVSIASGDTIKIKNVYVIDTTAFYGSGKEPSSVASFNVDFPNMYYPYTEGELWNAPVKSVVSQIMGNAKVYARQTINPTNMSAISENTRARTEICKIPPSKTMVYSVSSKSGKSVRVAIEGFSSAGKRIVDIGWVNDSSYTYKYTDDTVEYVALIFSYTDDSTVADNDIVLSWNVGNETTVSLSEIVKDLPDYGIEGNVLDLENMKYYHNRAEYDLGLCTFTDAGQKRFATSLPNLKPASNTTEIPKLIMAEYEPVSFGDIYNNTSLSGVISVSTGGSLSIRKSDWQTANDVKTALNGKILIYELATPEVIDLTTILYPFAVESGGTIEFVNEHNLDVPNTVLYKKEVL